MDTILINYSQFILNHVCWNKGRSNSHDHTVMGPLRTYSTNLHPGHPRVYS